MNSEERRAARRKRREEKRAAKRAERVRNCTLERIADPNALYIAAKQCGRNVKWKASIQTYLVHILRNITKARADILNGVDFCRPTNDFVIYEQGVRREISAVKIYERVIKKSYCQNALVPAVVPTLIANNYANVKGRGTLYAIQHVKHHMARHFRKHGTDGYILLVDISKYFASIDHEHAKEILEQFDDPRLKALGTHFVDRQGEVGLGLGDEPNQIHAVAFLSPIDHFVTECCGVEAYGRYMDDLYAIHTSKEHLQDGAGLHRGAVRRQGHEAEHQEDAHRESVPWLHLPQEAVLLLRDRQGGREAMPLLHHEDAPEVEGHGQAGRARGNDGGAGLRRLSIVARQHEAHRRAEDRGEHGRALPRIVPPGKHFPGGVSLKSK